MSFPGPVLVTGAGGFVGGHVARALAGAGAAVRGLSRRAARVEAGDPEIDWIVGDLRDPSARSRALGGAWGVVHAAGWVSLGRDRKGEARAVNVEATRALLDEAEGAGVARFVFTSTLWTVAAGTAAAPADEDSAWNLAAVDGPYCATKREAEQLVRGRSRPGFATCVLCPGLVIGPRDVRPTSTRLLLEMAGAPVVALPGGGIPVVDADVLAQAHIRALRHAEPGGRYVVAGPYLSYHAMAGLVARLAGWPRVIVPIPDACAGPLGAAGWVAERLRLGPAELSRSAVAGGFLRLHVAGARADAAFGLAHPPPLESIAAALEDHRRSGRAPWLKPLAR